jgi:PDZ domain
MGRVRKSRFFGAWRHQKSPPPPDARAWVHPSELPSFDALSPAPPEPARTKAARVIGTILLVTLLIGGAGLASTTNPVVPDRAPTVGTLSALPTYARVDARRTVDLTITTPGHVVSNVAAMALPNNLAVTTTPIAPNALVTATVPGHANFPVKWIGRDKTMGFTIVRLGVDVPALSFAPLPAATSVVAISPVLTGSSPPLRFAWADTTLGDPVLHANGVVSYLATESDRNISGFVDAIAVNPRGEVVAVLSTGHLWYSAEFVAKVAEILYTGFGCHGSLNVRGKSAQGGGAQITWVRKNGASHGRLEDGDVVTSVDGHNIDTWDTLLTVLYLTPSQSQVPVTFIRHASTHRTVITLACAI